MCLRVLAGTDNTAQKPRAPGTFDTRYIMCIMQCKDHNDTVVRPLNIVACSSDYSLATTLNAIAKRLLLLSLR